MFVYKKKSFISKKSRVYPFSRFTNSSLDDYSYIGLFANVNNTKIGKYCSISTNFKSGLGNHPIKSISTSPVFYSKKYALKNSIFFENQNIQEYQDIKIGNDVWIGSDVLLLDGITIGNGAIVGAKSLVTKDVPDFAIVGGVPAKVISYRFPLEIQEELLKIKWWDWDNDKIIKNKFLFTKNLELVDLKNILNNDESSL